MITFTQESFAKVLFFRNQCMECNISDSKSKSFVEVSLMGISENNEDKLNRIVKVMCVPQICTAGTTEFKDKEYASWREDRLIDDKLHPETFSSIWIHTHPGSSPTPSSVDEENFKKMRADSDFTCMYIVARKDNDYCRTVYNSRLGQIESEKQAKVEVNNWIVNTSYIFDMETASQKYGISFIENTFLDQYKDQHDAWLKELKDNVSKRVYETKVHHYNNNHATVYTGGYKPNQNAHIGFVNNSKKTLTFEEKKESLLRRLALAMLQNNTPQLSKKAIKETAGMYNENFEDLKRAYRIMMNMSDHIDGNDICQLINMCPEIMNGLMPQYDNLTNYKQAEIASKIGVSPFFLRKAIVAYVNACKSAGA